MPLEADSDSKLYLVVREGLARGTAITIPPGRCVVGTAEGVGLRIDAPGVAPEHLHMEIDALGVAWAEPVADAQVAVNGVPIARRTMLEVGDRVGAGSLSLELAAGDWAPSAGDTAVHSAAPKAKAPAPAPPSSTPMFVKDQLISERYRVVQKLAAGGMGEVYRVQHVELGRHFALKVMRAELSSTADFVDRFRREAVASSRIGHPNIIDITDFGRTAEGAFYFVMEHLEGFTLGQMIQRDGPLPVPRVMHLARQLCGALAAAHDAGIVHRDLKPDNVMVVQRPGAPDLVKVLDFGIAKVEAGSHSGGQTGFGVVVGTPQYMSPEQAAGLAVDLRSDIYSLGLIFYELLAGRPAFDAETPPLLMMQQISESAPPLPPVLAGVVPLGLERAVFSMLSKRPEHRPQTMLAVLELLGDGRLPSGTGEVSVPTLPPMFAPRMPVPAPALGQATRPDTPRARAVTPPAASSGTVAALAAIRRSRRQRDLALGVGLVLVLGLGGMALFSSSGEERPVAVAPKPVPVVTVAPPPPAVIAPLPTAPQMVRVEVKTFPADSLVEVDGVSRGVAPTLVVEAGKPQTIKVTRRGFVAQTMMITSQSNRDLEVRLERVRKPASGQKPELKDATEDDLKELE